MLLSGLITSVSFFFLCNFHVVCNLEIDILSFVMLALHSALLSAPEVWLNSEYIITLPVNSTESSSDPDCFKLY
jgi:hypothetical protein